MQLGYADGNILYAGSVNKHLFNVVDSGGTVQTSGGRADMSPNGSALGVTINGPCNIIGAWVSGLSTSNVEAFRAIDNKGNAWYSNQLNAAVAGITCHVRYIGLGDYGIVAGGSATFWGYMQGLENGSLFMLVDYR